MTQELIILAGQGKTGETEASSSASIIPVIQRYAMSLWKFLVGPSLYEIHDAVRRSDLAALKALLQDNPNLIYRKDGDNNTPLHVAAEYGHKDAAAMLLAGKAETEVQDDDGATPLHYATVFGHKDTAALLLAHHAQINAKDYSGHTPLRLATFKGHQQLATLLRQSGGHE